MRSSICALLLMSLCSAPDRREWSAGFRVFDTERILEANTTDGADGRLATSGGVVAPSESRTISQFKVQGGLSDASADRRSTFSSATTATCCSQP